jgi:hypothetical protein
MEKKMREITVEITIRAEDPDAVFNKILDEHPKEIRQFMQIFKGVDA